MSEENRHQSFMTLAALIADGMKDGKNGVDIITAALDEAERRGAEKMRERASEIPENHYWDSLTGQKHGESLATMIRALPLEGPKDGRE
jgi:hypothetical protein